MDDNTSGPENESKFNLGVASQEAINGILNEIRKVSVNYDIKTFNSITTLGKSQHFKYRLVRQLFIRVLPFIKGINAKDIKDELNKIKVCWKPIGSGSLVYTDGGGGTMVTKNHEEVFLPGVDNKLDDFIATLVMQAQEDSKIFKVKMGEESLF